MSGNELRVTVMTGNTYTNVHAQTPAITVENREHSFRLDTQHHADGAQEERGRKQEGRKGKHDTFCILCFFSV